MYLMKNIINYEKIIYLIEEEEEKHVENLRNVKEKQKEGGKREKQGKDVVKTFHSSTQLLRLRVY